MRSNTLAMILAIIGGALYVYVGAGVGGYGAAVLILGRYPGTGLSSNLSLYNQQLGEILLISFAVGLVTGALMILGGVLMRFASARTRMGAILVLTAAIAGSLNTLGGALVGFIAALVASVIGLTENRPRPGKPVQPSALPNT